MLTKDLIKLLQEADPEGNTHVCVGNEDILTVMRLPAYYDGDLQVLERSDSPNYDVIGAKIVRRGSKVKILPHSIEDAIWTCEEAGRALPVDYSELGERAAEQMRERHEAVREDCRQMEWEIEWKDFQSWVGRKRHLATDTQGMPIPDMRQGWIPVQTFFNEHVFPTKYTVPPKTTPYEARMQEWDRRYEVEPDGTVTKKEESHVEEV